MAKHTQFFIVFNVFWLVCSPKCRCFFTSLSCCRWLRFSMHRKFITSLVNLQQNDNRKCQHCGNVSVRAWWFWYNITNVFYRIFSSPWNNRMLHRQTIRFDNGFGSIIIIYLCMRMNTASKALYKILNTSNKQQSEKKYYRETFQIYV